MEFSANAQVLNDIDVRMGIFRGNTVSPFNFWFVYDSHEVDIKKKNKACYQWERNSSE